ncbi:MFS transporter [Klebsiella spallanzanii]|uniref:L-fucose-proton symporter n=1 Tax=Klebsiella spallanzanii TaxID=2587528 RepID=A0A564LHP5_9ENTR|nr:MFS transporter [Klebsiella spallanzanii]VUS81152.1 L-fucose-proton symporter [Klebsiella spallanzanii]
MKKTGLFISPDGNNQFKIFCIISMLFLVLGFSTGMIDILNKHFQNTLEISKAKSALIQFANYISYFFVAIPAGILAQRYGYKSGIIVGLVLIMCGTSTFMLATVHGEYMFFLTGIFILAAGLTFIETIANPYVIVLGNNDGGAARLNISQSIAGLGLIFGPLIGGHFVLSATGEVSKTNDGLFVPYLGIFLAVTLILLVFFRTKVPEVTPEADERISATEKPFWQLPHFVFAVIAQFLYVTGQTGIFSFFINYVVEHSPSMTLSLASLLPSTWTYSTGSFYQITERGASQILAFGGFGLFMIGRLTGGMLLSKIKTQVVLSTFALINSVLMVIIIYSDGYLATISLVLSFYFMSIMFPAIFSLGIAGLGGQTKKASSIIVMSIVGGAVMPMLMGAIADHYDMATGFIMPLICFVFILFYALTWTKLYRGQNAEIAVSH